MRKRSVVTPKGSERRNPARKLSSDEFQRRFSQVFLLAILAPSCASTPENCTTEGGSYTQVVALPPDGAAGAMGEAGAGGANGAAGDPAVGGSMAQAPLDCAAICAGTPASLSLSHCAPYAPGQVLCSFSGPTMRVCYEPGVSPGRRPAGFAQAACECASLGELFAVMAQLEAASVPAFERLASELGELRAPASLCRRARRAARDEVRHARQMSGLAAAYGASPKPFDLAEFAPRSLFEIALENEVEGCVREAYSALVARYQSEYARDICVRRIAAAIAPDEAEHASLSFAVSRWLRERLTPSERRAVQRARERAFAELEQQIAQNSPDPWHDQAGLPRPRAAQRILAALRGSLRELAEAA